MLKDIDRSNLIYDAMYGCIETSRGAPYICVIFMLLCIFLKININFKLQFISEETDIY
jgi:hypothetical protein